MITIDLNYLDQMIRDKKKEIENEPNDNILLQKIQLINLILNYYYEKLEPKVDMAVSAANTLVHEITCSGLGKSTLVRSGMQRLILVQSNRL